jgi:hypothetical protein
MFFGEVSATFPEFSDEDCSTWDIVDGLLKSRISILDEYIAEETSSENSGNVADTSPKNINYNLK